MTFVFTPEQKRRIEAICSRYPVRRAAVLPVLWMVQEQEGWVSKDAMRAVSEILDISPTAVYEVVTFYTMFEETPCARHHVQVCRTIGCWLRGGKQVTRYIENKLGVKVGQHTPDNRFKLSEVECLGSCGTAPMMQIGNDYFEDLTPDKVDQILAEHK